MSELIPQAEAGPIVEALCERFGVSGALFENYSLYMGSKGKVYMRNTHDSEARNAAVIGLHIATVAGAVKPSTNFVQIFGRHFCRNVIPVTSTEARELIAGLNEFPATSALENVTDGYVALSCDGQSFLCGFLKNGVVQNMLPKSRRRVLEFV